MDFKTAASGKAGGSGRQKAREAKVRRREERGLG
jgi:hypothetical protein